MRNSWLPITLAALAAAPAARADSPLPPPADVTRCNSAKTFCAVATVADGKTTLYKVVAGKRTAQWSVRGWSRSLFVSEDGKYVARGYDGLNLIPTDAPPDLVMVELFAGGKQTAKVSLKALVGDLKRLQRTVSHLHWGQIAGFDAGGLLLVRLADGSEVRVEPATGKVL